VTKNETFQPILDPSASFAKTNESMTIVASAPTPGHLSNGVERGECKHRIAPAANRRMATGQNHDGRQRIVTDVQQDADLAATVPVRRGRQAHATLAMEEVSSK
jgi:hypothetical protein